MHRSALLALVACACLAQCLAGSVSVTETANANVTVLPVDDVVATFVISGVAASRRLDNVALDFDVEFDVTSGVSFELELPDGSTAFNYRDITDIFCCGAVNVVDNENTRPGVVNGIYRLRMQAIKSSGELYYDYGTFINAFSFDQGTLTVTHSSDVCSAGTVAVSGTAADPVLTLPDGCDHYDLVLDAQDADTLRLDSTALTSAHTLAVAGVNSVTLIDGDGEDSLRIDSLPSNLIGSLTVSFGDEDVVQVSGGAISHSASISLAAGTVSFQDDVSVSGSAALTASAARTVRVYGALETGSGDLTLSGSTDVAPINDAHNGVELFKGSALRATAPGGNIVVTGQGGDLGVGSTGLDSQASEISTVAGDIYLEGTSGQAETGFGLRVRSSAGGVLISAGGSGHIDVVGTSINGSNIGTGYSTAAVHYGIFIVGDDGEIAFSTSSGDIFFTAEAFRTAFVSRVKGHDFSVTAGGSISVTAVADSDEAIVLSPSESGVESWTAGLDISFTGESRYGEGFESKARDNAALTMTAGRHITISGTSHAREGIQIDAQGSSAESYTTVDGDITFLGTCTRVGGPNCDEGFQADVSGSTLTVSANGAGRGIFVTGISEGDEGIFCDSTGTELWTTEDGDIVFDGLSIDVADDGAEEGIEIDVSSSGSFTASAGGSGGIFVTGECFGANEGLFFDSTGDERWETANGDIVFIGIANSNATNSALEGIESSVDSSGSFSVSAGGTGSISVSGTSDSNEGILLNSVGNEFWETANGDITFIGISTGDAADSAFESSVSQNLTVHAGGSGSINVIGVCNGTGRGVELESTGVERWLTDNGDITIDGTSEGSFGLDISFNNDGFFVAGGAGTVTLRGHSDGDAGLRANSDPDLIHIESSDGDTIIHGTTNDGGSDGIELLNPVTVRVDGAGSASFEGTSLLLSDTLTIHVSGAGAADLRTPLVGAGTLVIEEGAFNVHSDSSAFAGTTTVENGGVLQGTSSLGGPVTVEAGGIVSAGLSPGCMTYTGDVDLSAGGALLIEVDGPSACSGYDVISIGGDLILGAGAGGVSVVQGPTPPLDLAFGQVLSVVSVSGSITGTVGTISLSPATNVFSLTVDTTSNEITLRADQVVNTATFTDTPLFTLGGSFTTLLTFANPVTNLDASDFVVAGGAVTNIVEIVPNLQYRITANSECNGIITLTLQESAVFLFNAEASTETNNISCLKQLVF